MAKLPSTPLEQTARLLDLVPFLLANQGIALDALAEHFSVDNEVMLDDLNTLWMCGLPGYTPLELIDLEFDSGFVTIRNAAPLSEIRTMSSTELVALILGLDLLLQDTLDLAQENRKRIQALAQRLRNHIGPKVSISVSSESTNRSIIATAIAQRKDIQMSYYSASSDQISDRVVTAYHFFQEGDFEYFEGYCHTSLALKTFRVDRIASATLTEQVNVNAYGARAHEARVRVQARVLNPDRQTAESFGLSATSFGEKTHVELEAFSQEWLVRAILAANGSLAVEQPQEFIDLIRLSADQTLALYE
jgi:proteasome accessory factor C